MTETTEGLARATSSGGDSSAAAARAAKTNRASSASHGGSLRLSIFRAFFSKGLIEPWPARLFRRGSRPTKPSCCCAPRPSPGGRRRHASNYDGIFGEVNQFVTKLCRRLRGGDFKAFRASALNAERAARVSGGRPSLAVRASCDRTRESSVLPVALRSHVARDDDIARGRLAFGLERNQQAEVRERSLGLDLRLVALARVHDLAELGVLAFGRDGPQHVLLARRRVLQLVEARDDLGRAVLARRDREVHARAGGPGAS